MIEIKKIRIETDYICAKLIADIVYKGKNFELWYKADKNFAKYFCEDRADAFVVALLLFAMKNNLDIKSYVPISERLMYNITNYIMKLYQYDDEYNHNIKIITSTTNKIYDECSKYNGTGISCGVDSFATISEHTSNLVPQNMRVNCLTFFNMGSNGDFGGEKARELYNKRFKRAEKFSQEYGFEFLKVDSNINEFINMPFVPTHAYRNCSVVLALQKMFKTYYYSSGYTIFEFCIDTSGPAHFETFLLDMLSIENVKFYSSGTIYNRTEKVKIVSEYSPSYKYLNVCCREDENCSECEKCIRTMLALDIIGKLEKYNKVFDLDKYNKNREQYIQYAVEQLKNKNQLYNGMEKLL